MGCVWGVVLVAVVGVIVLISKSLDTSNRLRALEEAFEQQRIALSGLQKRFQALTRELKTPPASEPAPEPAPEETPPPPRPEPPPRPAAPAPAFEPLPSPANEAMAARAALERLPRPAFDWESLVGVRLFSWMAGIMLTIAALS